MWPKIVAFLAVTISAILFLNICMSLDLRDSATIIGTNFTAVSIYLAYLSIRETHEWNRRNLTIQLMGNWNQQTRSHLDVLMEQFPDFAIRPQSSADDQWAANPEWIDPRWSMNDRRAGEIVSSMSKQNDTKDKEIYRSLISLIDYFESIASAYENSVVDRVVVEQSFAPLLIDVSRYFRPFIIKKRKQAGREPWPPLAKAVIAWERENFRVGLDHNSAQDPAAWSVMALREVGRIVEISYPWKCKLTEGRRRCPKILPRETLAQMGGGRHPAAPGGRAVRGHEAPLAAGAGGAARGRRRGVGGGAAAAAGGGGAGGGAQHLAWLARDGFGR